jgi:hypothetical protein
MMPAGCSGRPPSAWDLASRKAGSGTGLRLAAIWSTLMLWSSRRAALRALLSCGPDSIRSPSTTPASAGSANTGHISPLPSPLLL